MGLEQLGAKPVDPYVAGSVMDPVPRRVANPLVLRDRKGGDMAEWPADLRIREFPRSAV